MRTGHDARVREVGIGVVRALFVVAPVFELGADAVLGVDFEYRADAAAEVAVAFGDFRMGREVRIARGVIGVFVRDGRVPAQVGPCRGVEVEAARVDVDVAARRIEVVAPVLCGAHRQRPVQPVLAAFAERDPDDAAR